MIAGDGCLEEGISHEAASLAGHLKLGRLVYIYDDNHISIDGPTELALDDDPVERFEAYGWHVDNVGEIANDLDGLEAALRRAMADEEAPSLIVLRSHIAYPSPDHTDDFETHGYALKDAEIAATKAVMGIPDELVLGARRRRGHVPRGRPAGSGPPDRVGGRGWRHGAAIGPASTPRWPAPGCPAGTPSSRRSPPATRSRPGWPAAPASTPSPTSCPVCCPAPPT